MFKNLVVLDIVKSNIKTIFGRKLISLYSYGYASDELKQVEKERLNLLIILKKSDVEDLGQMAKLQKELTKKYFRKNPAVIKIFTEEEFKNSLDVFPIEFLEIQGSQNLLAGKDILSKLKISKENLRHELEFYLRTHIIKLREGYIHPSSNVHALIRESFPFLLSLFKYILVLKNQKIPQSELEVLKKLHKNFKLNLDIFDTILNHLDKKDLSSFFPQYLSEIESITKQIDQIK